jgi:hypothetical protein
MPLPILTLEQLTSALQQGSYSSIGSYPLFFVTQDGEALSPKAAEENRQLLEEALNNPDYPCLAQWRVVAHDVNWEDPALYCSHSGARIPSAYAEPEDDAHVDEGET